MIVLRETTLDDAEVVHQVELRHGMSGLTPDQWRAWWNSHPSRASFAGVPLGWLLVDDQSGSAVGTIANVQMLCDFQGRLWKAAIAGNWAVDHAYRQASLRLKSAYFRQPGIDLWLNGSASETTSRVLPSFKAERIPSPEHDVALLWITHYPRFAAAGLRRKNIPGGALAAWPAAAALAVRDLLRGRRSLAASDSIQRLTTFDERFDRFWKRLCQGPPCLRAVRSRDMLAWRFPSLASQNQGVILTFSRGSDLAGYALLLPQNRDKLDLKQYLLGDLQALDDDPAVLKSLMIAAIRATREDGLDLLEWRGWNSRKRQVARTLAPLAYRYPCWQAFYKASSELREALSTPDPWDFSPFDTF